MGTQAIAVGAHTSNATLMRAIEFDGVENQAAALASQASDLSAVRVVLCSSMETTNPHPLPFMGGPVLFWKLNAEAFLGSSGIGSAIIKPCGIEGTYGRGGKHLNVGHDDRLVGTGHGAISRADVAAVMVEAVAQRARDLRFDICVGDGVPTTDLAALLESTRRPWQKK